MFSFFFRFQFLFHKNLRSRKQHIEHMPKTNAVAIETTVRMVKYVFTLLEQQFVAAVIYSTHI